MINRILTYASSSLDPYENLATESYLLHACPEDAVILYLWQNKDTVVIGKNQNPWTECRCELMKEENVKLARRLSGGGAVFHDLGNLNFTFLCASGNYDLQKQLEVISRACAMAGIETELSGRNDILACGRKFSGNAFYNSKGKSYHHGTIMISADKERMSRYLTPPRAKLISKGIKSVKSRVINLSELNPSLTSDAMKEYMINAFDDVYGKKALKMESPQLTLIKDAKTKFSSDEFIYGFKIPFTFSAEGRFQWGSCELCLLISDGIIKEAKLYTDSMDNTLSHKTEDALKNCRFDLQDIKNALKSADKGNDLISLMEENFS